MAKTKSESQAAPAEVELVLLRDCQFGAVGQVLTLPAADAQQAVLHGMADPHPAAVAHAKANG